jgi:DNA-directed RNA polymerase specialized sigma24 family protein
MTNAVPEKSAVQANREAIARNLDKRKLARLKNWIIAKCNSRVLNRVGASEILQNALKSFLEYDNLPDDPERLLRMLNTFVQRKIKNACRDQRAQKRDAWKEEGLEVPDEVANAAKHRDPTASEEAIIKEERSRLSAEEWIAVNLDRSNCSYREIAEVLNCSEKKAERIVKAVHARWARENKAAH